MRQNGRNGKRGSRNAGAAESRYSNGARSGRSAQRSTTGGNGRYLGELDGKVKGAKPLWHNQMMRNDEEQVNSAEETVTISRAEYESMQAQIQWLMEQLRLSRHRRFGASSWQTLDEGMEQLDLPFNEAEVYADQEATEAEDSVAVARTSVIRSMSTPWTSCLRMFPWRWQNTDGDRQRSAPPAQERPGPGDRSGGLVLHLRARTATGKILRRRW